MSRFEMNSPSADETLSSSSGSGYRGGQTAKIQLDLSDEYITWLNYDGEEESCEVTLFCGDKDVTSSASIDIETTGCSASYSGNTITITGLSRGEATIDVSAVYADKTYTATLIVVKGSGSGIHTYRYRLELSERCFKVKDSTVTPSKITVNVYWDLRTSNSPSKTLLQKLEGYVLKVDGSKVTYGDGSYILTSKKTDTQHIVALYDMYGNLLDRETVPVLQHYNSVDDGHLYLDCGTRHDVEVDEEYLQSLSERTRLDDDYDSHDILVPKYAFTYNQRLTVANLHKQMASAFSMMTTTPFTNYVDCAREASASNEIVFYTRIDCIVTARHDGNEYAVNDMYPSGQLYSSRLVFFYYPDNAAKYVFFRIRRVSYKSPPTEYPGTPTTDGLTFRKIPLKVHETLNGAYAFYDWGNLLGGEYACDAAEWERVSDLCEQGAEYAIENKVYQSEVGNPFSFPLNGIVTIGSSHVYGLASAVEALSEGQFGAFPLYAFTDEGIWSLSVGDDGSYSARQPVSRDVCTNTDSITSIDSSVMFATERGMMEIAGSNCQLFTSALDGRNILPLDSDTFSEIWKVYGCANLIGNFSNFMESCRVAYDYKGQRIMLYNPTYSYAYVFSLRSKLWGMCEASWRRSLNGYPDCLVEALGENGTPYVLNLSTQDSDTKSVRTLLVTRPLKLDEGDVLKTVTDILLRGYFRKGKCSFALFGSRDLFNWGCIGSVSGKERLRRQQGTPYKYFRLAVIADMSSDEGISGATVEFTDGRLDNKIR